MAFCNFPCWTHFSAALRTFCLLNPKPNAIKLRTPAPCFLGRRETNDHPTAGLRAYPSADSGQAWDGHSDTVIVRLDSPISMVTKGYQKGVYEWVGERGWRA